MTCHCHEATGSPKYRSGEAELRQGFVDFIVTLELDSSFLSRRARAVKERIATGEPILSISHCLRDAIAGFRIPPLGGARAQVDISNTRVPSRLPFQTDDDASFVVTHDHTRVTVFENNADRRNRKEACGLEHGLDGTGLTPQ